MGYLPHKKQHHREVRGRPRPCEGYRCTESIAISGDSDDVKDKDIVQVRVHLFVRFGWGKNRG